MVQSANNRGGAEQCIRNVGGSIGKPAILKNRGKLGKENEPLEMMK